MSDRFWNWTLSIMVVFGFVFFVWVILDDLRSTPGWIEITDGVPLQCMDLYRVREGFVCDGTGYPIDVVLAWSFDE